MPHGPALSFRTLAPLAGGLLWASGCQTVDPRQDFDSAAQAAGAVSGHAPAYRPDDESAIASRVAELLDDGLTLSEAVETCLLNNPSLQGAFMDVGIARAEAVQAGLLSNPTLGLAVRFPSGGGLANLDASLAQNIADLWQLPARRRAADHELDGAILELARRTADLATDARQAYFRAVGLRQVHTIAGENLATARELLQLALAQRQAGVATELDVNLSRSAVLDAELEAEAARVAAADARRQLARLLGLTTEAESLALSDPLPDPAAVGSLDGEALRLRAMDARLDVRVARHTVASARARLEEEGRSVFGDVSVGLSMERAERQSEPSRDLAREIFDESVHAGQPALPDFGKGGRGEDHTDFIIGPSFELELPIFDQNQAGIAEAYYAWRRAAKTLDAIERPIVHEVRQAADHAQSAWRLVALYREQALPLAESNVALSREAYRAGSTSLLGVLEAQRFLLTTRRRYVEAWQSAAETIPALEKVVAAPAAEFLNKIESPATGDQP